MSKLCFNLPQDQYRKGQNGKVLIIGGSNLFHAASLWSAKICAHLVDMVFYASSQESNLLAKNNFNDGIVISRLHLQNYLEEADTILLGPGMTRNKRQKKILKQILHSKSTLTSHQWQNDTYLIVNYLLARYPQKKFVLDAGALQMLELDYLQPQHILTPHQQEFSLLKKQTQKFPLLAPQLHQTTILSKNIIDQIYQQQQLIATSSGGNAGLTKGGSGDVLAGLIAGLYCYNDARSACLIASQTLKKSATILAQKFGPFFTTSQLLEQAPLTLWQIYQDCKN